MHEIKASGLVRSTIETKTKKKYNGEQHARVGHWGHYAVGIVHARFASTPTHPFDRSEHKRYTRASVRQSTQTVSGRVYSDCAAHGYRELLSKVLPDLDNTSSHSNHDVLGLLYGSFDFKYRELLCPARVIDLLSQCQNGFRRRCVADTRHYRTCK